ncbi:MAG TPA: hypothetical protein VHD83_06270 [Puia sp.]|nr:hypothetical protein [Puia sp.]
MKLLIITSLKEYLPQATALLKKAGVAVYSVNTTTGVRTNDGGGLLDDWFGSHSGEFDSIVLFSFTDVASAAGVVDLVDGYNRENNTGFPLRAFVLPVEKTSQ